MRGRGRQALDPLPRPAHQGERRVELRGHVGAKPHGDLLQIRDLAGRQAQHRGGVGAATAQPRRDRRPLLDLDPQRRSVPARLAQRRQRPRRQVLALDRRAMDLVALGLADLDQVRQRQRLEQRAELVQAVLAPRPEVEAEIELGGGVDLHRRAPRLSRWSAASPTGRRNPRARAPRRGRRRGGRAPPAPPGRGPATRAERARASGPAPCAGGRRRPAPARASRVRRPARVRRSARIADSTRGRGLNTAGSTLRSIRTSQASWARTLGAP